MDWETPPEFFDLVNRHYGPFDLDAAALPSNSLCPRYLSPREDALQSEWGPVPAGRRGRDTRAARVWCNPPYGDLLGRFVEKAWHEWYHRNCTVTLLIPPRTDTSWWHRFVLYASDIWFVRGRISFIQDGQPCTGNTFPSVLVHFGHHVRFGGGVDVGTWCQTCGRQCHCDKGGLL